MANEINGDNLPEVQVEEVDNEINIVEENVPAPPQTFEPSLSTILEENSVPDDNGSTGRFEKLARPKRKHLEETLSKYGQYLKGETVERIQTQIREQGGNLVKLRRKKHVDDAVRRGSSKSQEIYGKLQTKLRKVAFDTLAERMFEKLPEMILSMEQQTAENMPSATKCLWQTLQCTLIARLGPPANEHEERMFRHICFGLTKFVETIIENVPNDQREFGMLETADRPRYSEEVELGRKALKEHNR
uniref:Uncharacterized protein n=1 Tax=Anopheles atroparvus TaxID=41427 RepID=A0AAG5CUT0_ANOAO